MWSIFYCHFEALANILCSNWEEKQRRRECCLGGANSMFFDCVLRHYHPRLFLHMCLGSRNVFPQPVLDDMSRFTGSTRQYTCWAEDGWRHLLLTLSVCKRLIWNRWLCLCLEYFWYYWHKKNFMKAGNLQFSPEPNMPWDSIWQHPLSPSLDQKHMSSKQGGRDGGAWKWCIKVIKFTPCGVYCKGCVHIQLEGIWGKAGASTLPVQTDCSSLWIPTQMPLGDRWRLAGYLHPVQTHTGVTSAYIRHLENQRQEQVVF